jgi:hypothetical protein
MNNRVLIGGIIGGVVFFLLGFLMYGLAFRGILEANTMPGLGRGEDEMQWAFLILGNLMFGFLIAYILDKANAASLESGATVAGIVGLLFGMAGNFISYATTHSYTSMTGVFIDIIIITVMCAIVGAVIGWYYGRNRRVVVA